MHPGPSLPSTALPANHTTVHEFAPKVWSSVCEQGDNGDGQTRVACIGDSNVAGDHFHLFNANMTGRCRMSDGYCRGNFPLDLQALLGSAYRVKNFGIPGIAACANLPTECLEPEAFAPPSPSKSQPPHIPLPQSSPPPPLADLRLPLHLSNASEEALNKCSIALRHQRHGLLSQALNFNPQVVIMMVGTNDASRINVDKCGSAEGVRRAILLLLKTIWQLPSKPPLVFLLSPPPVLGEFSSKGCVAMHTCRVSPFHKCSQIMECVTCRRGDKGITDGTCVTMADLLPIRETIDAIGHELSIANVRSHHRTSSRQTVTVDSTPTASRCNDAPLQFMSVIGEVPSSSDLLAGPIHLNARANALIACALHERLTGRCGANRCEAPRGLGSLEPNSSLEFAQKRHHAFCDPLRRALFGALHKVDTSWDVLQEELHPPLLGKARR